MTKPRNTEKEKTVMLTDMYSLRQRIVIAWWVITKTPFEFKPLLKKRIIIELPEIYVETE